MASTFNVDPIGKPLRSAFTDAGVAADVSIAPFGQISSAFLNSDEVDEVDDAPGNDTDVAVLIVSCEDDLSAFFRRPSTFPRDEADELVDARVGLLARCVSTVATRVKAVLVVAIGADRGPAVTGLRPATHRRRRDVVDRYVNGVLALDALAANVITLDWLRERLAVSGASEAPLTISRDPRLWYLARMRLDLKELAALAAIVVRHVRPVLRPARKAVIVDLDDTLWGGVLDEAGVHGLELGDEGVGLAFADVQRELIKLHDAGVAIALCSKNDHANAVSAIRSHAGMVLAPEHIAAMRIDWRDKAAMVREIAEELGFGLDALVFLDDNPIERDWVRTALPEVLVPELPRDPALRPAFIASLDAFDRLELTDADVQRERSRDAARKRDEHARATTDYDEFLTSLGQRIEIARVQASTLPRAAQLCERTNQFTLGTHRYTAGELSAMAADPDVEVCTATVRDRFEDSGITALTIVRFAGATAEVHGLMLSCRVLGRRIEDGLLAFIARRAVARGATALRVPYVATPRNGGVKAFLLRRGFIEQHSDQASVFSVPLGADASLTEWPAHVTLQGELVS